MAIMNTKGNKYSIWNTPNMSVSSAAMNHQAMQQRRGERGRVCVREEEIYEKKSGS